MRLAAAVSAAAIGAALGCGDSFKPSVDSTSGNYAAQVLTITDSTGTTDWITAGATLTLKLAANGTTTGHLFIPGGGAGGGNVDEDMAGTWLLTGDLVFFTQTADTFVRNMPFVATKNRLEGDQTFADGTRVRVVLTK